MFAFNLPFRSSPLHCKTPSLLKILTFLLELLRHQKLIANSELSPRHVTATECRSDISSELICSGFEKAAAFPSCKHIENYI